MGKLENAGSENLGVIKTQKNDDELFLHTFE